MNILEKNIDMFEKAVMQPLSTEEATDMNGGWCLILMLKILFANISSTSIKKPLSMLYNR